jgi:hypothetical protein
MKNTALLKMRYLQANASMAVYTSALMWAQSKYYAPMVVLANLAR